MLCSLSNLFFLIIVLLLVHLPGLLRVNAEAIGGGEWWASFRPGVCQTSDESTIEEAPSPEASSSLSVSLALVYFRDVIFSTVWLLSGCTTTNYSLYSNQQFFQFISRQNHVFTNLGVRCKQRTDANREVPKCVWGECLGGSESSGSHMSCIYISLSTGESIHSFFLWITPYSFIQLGQGLW